MKIIHKFSLADGDNIVRMPIDAKLLDVQLQDGKPMLWAIVETDNASARRLINIRGTGSVSLTNDEIYVATYQEPPFVWHVFDGGEL